MDDGFVRLGVLLLSATFLTCDAQANRPAPEEATAAARPKRRPSDKRRKALPPKPEGFDPATVRPAEGSALARARAALAQGDEAKARRIVEQALPEADELQAGRLRWVAAEAAAAQGELDAALELLEPLSEADHPLTRWARLQRAEWLEEREPAEAAREAAALTDARWAGRQRARHIEARSLAAAGDTDAAVPKLRALVRSAPAHSGAASAAMPLAAILASRDEVAPREQALKLYRRVATRAPLSRIGRRAQERADEVLQSLPPVRRRALRRTPVDDAFAKAEALLGSMRHDEADKAFEQVAKRVGNDPGKHCRARLQQGRAIYRQKDRARATKHMARLASRCRSADVRAWAHYYAGRAHAQRDERDAAIEHYERLLKVAPKHRLADDALFRAALVARGKNDTEGMLRRLEELPQRFPRGDMRGNARFLLAWHYREQGEHEKALLQLERLLDEGPQENAEDIAGRAAYWKARTLAALDRTEEAIDAYEQLARDVPLAYYAQQSLARLDELAPQRAASVREAMQRNDTRLAPLGFPERAEMQQAEFVAAVELLRVGATDRAMAELRSMGATGEGADRDMLWLVAALLDRAGSHPEASRLVRRRLPSFRRTMPVGRGYHLWRIAYPRAYAPLIEQVAADEQVPPTLVRAVAREESGFDPKAVSVAHAYGLIQLIRPTARRFAKELGLPHDPGALKTPEINLRIGTRFIAFLWKRLEDNHALIPAAYNAGEGAVSRWLRQRPDMPLDEWIEEIPYDQTRRYTRRVLQTWGIYSWLEQAELPPLPAKVPS